MAALFFNTRRRDVAEPIGNIGTLKRSIASELQRIGFRDIVNSQAEVAGNRNGVRVAVVHLPIAGIDFWEVVMAGGDVGNVTQATINEVVQRLRSMAFL